MPISFATYDKDSNSMTGNCILCGGDDLEIALDLGETPLANGFLSAAELENEIEVAHQLRLAICPTCGHVQLADLVPPAELFTDYLYISSNSTTLIEHLGDLAHDMTDRYELGDRDLVVDVGCNDGVLLEHFKANGVRTLGIDPAENLAPLSRARGLDVVVNFFGTTVANSIRGRYGPASAITMTNSFPHIPDLSDLLSGVCELLGPGGVFAIQAHYIVDMFEQAAFDTIYHEHVSYWSLNAIKRLLSKFDLEPVRVERLPIHHGQLRVYVQRSGNGAIDGSVDKILELERELGIVEGKPLREFAAAASRIRRDLQAFLRQAKADGKSVAAYGAPAKGSTLLNYLELGANDLLWIADISSLKQGRFMPGSHIPIVSPLRILDDMPDYLLLLAWNFAEEIISQNQQYVERGGRFVLPLPEVRVL